MTTDIATIDEHEAKRKAALVKAIGFDRLPPEQREIAYEYARQYDLDLLLRHVVIVEGKPYITRDGLLHVAHRSGVLDGIEVTDPELVKLEGVGEFWRARASVYRKDMSRPFVYQGRYPAKGGNTRFAPEMAVKVAEVMALRRAFDVSAPVIEERWDIETPITAPEPEVPLREQVAARRAAITSGPAPLVPQAAGFVDESRPTLLARPDEEVRDDPQGEPPPLAAAPDATPTARTGNAIEGNPMAAPADSEGQCSAPSPYGDDKICYLRNGHRNAHRSDAATWT